MFLHRWLPEETPTSFGGAAGWKKEAEDSRVVAFVDVVFRHRGPKAAAWRIGLALRIQTFSTPLSKVLEEDAFPSSGLPDKEQFNFWIGTFGPELEKQVAKSRY